MNEELIKLMTAALENNKFRTEQLVKQGKQLKDISYDQKVKIGQAMNQAVAEAQIKGKEDDILFIIKRSCYYENLNMIRQSLSLEELKEFLDKVTGVQNGK